MERKDGGYTLDDRDVAPPPIPSRLWKKWKKLKEQQKEKEERKKVKKPR